MIRYIFPSQLVQLKQQQKLYRRVYCSIAFVKQVYVVPIPASRIFRCGPLLFSFVFVEFYMTTGIAISNPSVKTYTLKTTIEINIFYKLQKSTKRVIAKKDRNFLQDKMELPSGINRFRIQLRLEFYLFYHCLWYFQYLKMHVLSLNVDV